MEKIVYNSSYEILVGISLLPNLTCSDRVEIAKNGISYSELEAKLGKMLCRSWDDELKWVEDDSDGVPKGHLFYGTDDYPESLMSSNNPPFVLAFRGEKPKGCSGNFAQAQSLCIVGTREASQNGRRAAFLLSLEAASNNIIVYSGYATGIDQSSHRGTAICHKPTFAVMPCGLNHTYSYRNRELMDMIYDAGGGFISQFSSTQEPYKWNFHYRNRILAEITDATVIIQAPESSGALITVHDALDCGRDVFVHSAGSGAENYQKGTQNLINDGGIVINNYADICSWTLNSFKGKKRVEEIDYSQIEKLLSTGECSESFYRFTDKWYKIA